MLTNSISRDLSIGIVAGIICSLLSGALMTTLSFLGPAWTRPLINGLITTLLVFCIFIAWRALRNQPSQIEPTNIDNIEHKALEWFHNFHLSVKNSPVPIAYFNFLVVTDGGKKILVTRTKDEWSNYLQFTSFIGPDEDEKKAISEFTEDEINISIINLKTELARARMGYTGFKSLTEGYSLFKRIPITQNLSEDAVLNMVWEMEAMLNTLYLNAVKDAYGFMAKRKLLENTGE